MQPTPDCHILVVEDNPDLRETLAELLHAEGYQVSAVPDGQAALNHLRASRLSHVIVLDLMMPGLNGWDFAGHVRRNRSLEAIPTTVERIPWCAGCCEGATSLTSIPTAPPSKFHSPLTLHDGGVQVSLLAGAPPKPNNLRERLAEG